MRLPDLSDPKKYWLWFLALAAVLFLGAVIFSAYLFLTLSSEQIIDAASEAGEIKINLSGLDDAAKILENRASDFKKVLAEPLIKDSL